MAGMIGFHCSCGKGYMVYTPKKLLGAPFCEFAGISQERTDEEERAEWIDQARCRAAEFGAEFIEAKETTFVTCGECGEVKDVMVTFRSSLPCLH